MKQEHQASLSKRGVGAQPNANRSLKTEFADWLEKGGAPGRKGLLSTTILEENDDSEDDF